MDLRDVKEFCIDTSKYIITIFVVIFIIVYVASVQQVVGSSMSPTFKNQDILILNKFYYRFFDIKRFDIVSNGVAIEESFLDDDVVTNDFSLSDLGYDVIPEDMYLVLGDNRGDSLDSRDIGLITKKSILGKVNIRIWPINKIRYVK